MNEHSDMPASKRAIWVRGVLMLLMAVLWHVAEMVLWVVAVIQFVLSLVSGAPNARLVALGSSLGRYMQQIVAFLTFVSEEAPFPFADWPSGA